MTIIEAARSRLRFRRKRWAESTWYDPDEGGWAISIGRDDILADDWEVDKPKVRKWRWVTKELYADELFVSDTYYSDIEAEARPDKFIQKIESEYIDV